MFGTETGLLAATGETIAVMLDLDARKAVAFSDEERATTLPHMRMPA